MSLGWLRFFGTSVNEEEKENSCGLRAEKFFTRTKHSSSRLHSSWSKDNVLPNNHANDVGRVQELRKTRIFGTCRKLDLIGKFNFLDDEKVNREKEKSKLVIAHLYFIMNIFFCAYLSKCFFWSTQLSRFEIQQRLLLHLRLWKDHLKSFQCCLRRLQSQLVILPCEIAGIENGRKKIRLWWTLFSSTSKMIHVIEKKILPPLEERSTKRKLLV